jgi:predicted DsbA family dithiol-disulfide isomerase
MTVTLYFDTTCPFTWITSRWLLQVNQQHQFALVFKPFSLALKNKDKTSIQWPSKPQSIQTQPFFAYPQSYADC